RLVQRHREPEVQIQAVPTEIGVRPNVHLDEQIAGRPAVAGRALAGDAEARALVGAGGNPDLDRLLGHDLALAVAGRTGRRELTAAAAGPARDRHPHRALDELLLAGALAGGAGLRLRPRLVAGAVAGRAGLALRHRDLELDAVERLDEVDVDPREDVLAAQPGPADATAREAA